MMDFFTSLFSLALSLASQARRILDVMEDLESGQGREETVCRYTPAIIILCSGPREVEIRPGPSCSIKVI